MRAAALPAAATGTRSRALEGRGSLGISAPSLNRSNEYTVSEALKTHIFKKSSTRRASPWGSFTGKATRQGRAMPKKPSDASPGFRLRPPVPAPRRHLHVCTATRMSTRARSTESGVIPSRDRARTVCPAGLRLFEPLGQV